MGRCWRSGGGAPSTVHLWNLQQEICMEQACPAHPLKNLQDPPVGRKPLQVVLIGSDHQLSVHSGTLDPLVSIVQ